MIINTCTKDLPSIEIHYANKAEHRRFIIYQNSNGMQ